MFSGFRIISALAALLLLSACGGSSASLATPAPTVAPTGAPAVATTGVPAVAPSALPATAELAEAGPTAAPRTETSTAALQLVEGQVVLGLEAGSADGQVGINSANGGFVGPRSFRIGADNTIRILDNVNKRVLFFSPEGKLTRTRPVAEAQDPFDFIVNSQDEMFVLDKASNTVLRYKPDGALAERITIDPEISLSADAVMLTGNQDLVLASGNQVYWVLLHQGEVVPPGAQPLTWHLGAATPRSPRVFVAAPNPEGLLDLKVNRLSGPQVDSLTLALPPETGFFNVDRAMNLYFLRDQAAGDVELWRAAPNATVAGGARIDVTGCEARSWRSFYVAQDGTAWTICLSTQGATIKRYTLLDQGGQPLAEAAPEAAQVSWRPGAQDSAA